MTAGGVNQVSHKGPSARHILALCILSLCRGVPRVWNQKAGEIPAEMESSGCSPGLPDQQQWLVPYQEQISRGPGPGAGSQKIAHFWQGRCEKPRLSTGSMDWRADSCDHINE
eukprot:1140526-Pelagomonas_calceolata.AAC.2